MELTISREDFNNFLRVTKVVENACSDLDIKHSSVIQKSNTGHCVIQMDLTQIFGNDCNMPIQKIKETAGILKIFENNDSSNDEDESEDNVFINIEEKVFKISDIMSELTFTKPAEKFMDNIYIDNPETLSALDGSDDELLLDYTISSNLAKRIKSVCDGFRNDIITCYVDGEYANLNISTTSKDNYSDIVKQIPLNQISDQKYSFNIQAYAFSGEGGDINIKVYKKGNVLLWKFKQNIFKVPVNISGRSKAIPAKS